MLATRRAAQRPVRSARPPVPTDPAAVVASVRKLFYHLAGKVRASVRLDGPGHGEAEADELVNEAVVALLEALQQGRFDPAKALLSTYAYQLASRVMRQYARAAHFGLSAREYHRQCARSETPHWHEPVAALDRAPGRTEEDRESRRRVEVILSKLTEEDREPLQVYLEDNGSVEAVRRRVRNGARRLRRAMDHARAV